MTKDELALWKLHPITQEVMKQIQRDVSGGLEELAAGVHSQDIAKTYLLIGKLNAYSAFLSVDFETEDKDD